jgi:thiamine kinase-like enzyme
VKPDAVGTREGAPGPDARAAGPACTQVLRACEAAAGEPIVANRDITPRGRPGKRVFFIQFASGSKLKLSFSSKGAHARVDLRNAYLRAIPSANFSRIVLHGDHWVASEWIDGTPLSELALSSDLLEQAARLLQAVHRANVHPESGAEEAVMKRVRATLEEKLRLLGTHGMVFREQAAKILDLHGGLARQRRAISLVHGDFAPSNLVLSQGRLYSVDNEDMGLHSPDYDLCRAITMWDEWNGAGERLFAAYAATTGRQLSPRARLFWTLFDLVYRAGYALAQFGERDGFCATRLGQVLELEVGR